MSAPQFMRATPLVIICLSGFAQARTLYMQLKRPSSVTFPESAFCICSAILVGIRCACDAGAVRHAYRDKKIFADSLRAGTATARSCFEPGHSSTRGLLLPGFRQ